MHTPSTLSGPVLISVALTLNLRFPPASIISAQIVIISELVGQYPELLSYEESKIWGNVVSTKTEIPEDTKEKPKFGALPQSPQLQGQQAQAVYYSAQAVGQIFDTVFNIISQRLTQIR